MENLDNELVKKLIDESETFKNNYRTHKDYGDKVSRLDKKSYLSPDESTERNRLKKLKLALKDEMERELSRFRQNQ
jgi:uncharacterized protein YdcH (DUF465 family)